MATYSRVIPNLVNGQPYFIRVAAVSPSGTGAFGPTPPLVASPTPDAQYISDYIRTLTGVFSKDILSDALILFWINEAYAELGRMFDWPWLPIAPLSANQSPAFDADFATILAYRVAPRVLELEADDSPRAAAYRKEFETMLANMYKHLLRSQDVGAPASMSDLVLLVRTLLDEYSQSLDTAMIENKIMDVHEELISSEAWVFPSAVFPRIGWENARILAYGAAARIGPFVGKEAAASEQLVQEYAATLKHLRIKIENNYSSRLNTAEGLVRQARTFLGDYSKKVSDSLLKTWVYEEYQNICAERDWAWLQRVEDKVITAGNNLIPLATANVKIHEINVITIGQSGNLIESEPLLVDPSLIGVQHNDAKIYYKYDHETAKLTIAPVQTKDITLRIRYEIVPAYGTAMPSTIDGATGDSFFDFAIPDRYIHIIAYRTAMRACVMAEAPQPLFDLCNKSADALYAAMYNEYQLSHTQEPFQLGGNALESRKYVPWFRTA